MLRKLYHWVLHWAYTPYGTPALFILAFAESSFFPIPPDPLLMAMALSRPRRSFFYAGMTTIASILGGMLGYFIGAQLWKLTGDLFFSYIPGFTPQVFELVRESIKTMPSGRSFPQVLPPFPLRFLPLRRAYLRLVGPNFSWAHYSEEDYASLLLQAFSIFVGQKLKYSLNATLISFP